MGISWSETDILAVAARWRDDGQAVALGTVVHTAGSAPRQAGSHVAIRQDGAFAGSVSAGCVENAVIETALQVLRDRRPRNLRFGTARGAMGLLLGGGMTCGGEIDIFIEPVG